MLKTLGSQIKEFKKDSILTPIFMILEVIMETVIPLLMASIIDDGVFRHSVFPILTSIRPPDWSQDLRPMLPISRMLTR